RLSIILFLFFAPHPPSSTLFPYTTLFRSEADPNWLLALIEPEWAKRYGRKVEIGKVAGGKAAGCVNVPRSSAGTGRNFSPRPGRDRKSTRLNSSHDQISYAVFCLKKKKNK